MGVCYENPCIITMLTVLYRTSDIHLLLEVRPPVLPVITCYYLSTGDFNSRYFIS